MFDCEPAEKELVEFGSPPPPPALIAHCQSKSPVTVGVMLPAAILVELLENGWQAETSTAPTL
jgi:hypothetical protein